MTHTTDWTRLGVVVTFAILLGFLSYLGKSEAFITAVLTALGALALGFMRGPTQINRRSTDAPPSEDKTP